MKSLSVGPFFLAATLGLFQACGSTSSDNDQGTPAAQSGAALQTGDAGQPPVQLTTYDDVKVALETGQDVRAVFHYASCTLDSHGPGPDAVGGMDVATFEYFAANVVGNPSAYVSFSESSLVLLGQQYIIDYVKVRLFEDATVNIIVEYLDPRTYAVSVHETFACSLATTADSADGAFFYRR